MSSSFNVYTGVYTLQERLAVSATCMKTGYNMVYSHSKSVCVVASGTAATRTHIAGSCEGTNADPASSDLRQLAANRQSMTLTEELLQCIWLWSL